MCRSVFVEVAPRRSQQLLSARGKKEKKRGHIKEVGRREAGAGITYKHNREESRGRSRDYIMQVHSQTFLPFEYASVCLPVLGPPGNIHFITHSLTHALSFSLLNPLTSRLCVCQSLIHSTSTPSQALSSVCLPRRKASRITDSQD